MNSVKVLVSSHSGSQIINSLEHPDELDHLDNLDHLDHLDQLDHLDHLDHPDQLNHSDKSQPRLIKQFIKIDAEFVYLVLLLVGFRNMIFIHIVSGLEAGEMMTLEDEISHLQKENSRIESQLSR